MDSQKPLKAFCVMAGGEWGAFVAAKSRGECKSLMTGRYDDTPFTGFRVYRAHKLDDVAAAQDEATVMECIDGFGPIFRNRNLCCEGCIESGCQYGPPEPFTEQDANDLMKLMEDS